MELDALKRVTRRTRLLNHGRHENSAEHSWHFAMAAMSLAPWAPEGTTISRVIEMALVHDIVEIDVGDVLVYDLAGRAAVAEREAAAARRIFGLLPAAQSARFLALWEEYEAGTTAEARFAGALDRLLPVIQNLHNEGQSWRENDIALEQVLSRNAHVAQTLPALWDYVEQQLYSARDQGWLR
ncbi:HD domain-containing protein [Shimwellia pseudoproteus]|uniref:HD domain-containing protein n=1 Tax=Shimwellia pseudoproteus TaxID=570012 RepID=UPI0018EC8BC0|nr:HD domain-containing protein [Shimwellia pseudoproteus]